MGKSIWFLMIFLISACSPSANEHNYQANQAFKAEAYRQALRGYQQAQVQSPDDMVYYFNAALTYAELRQFNQALDALALARLKMDVHHENADLYYNLGNIYAQMGRYQDAIGAFRYGLRINPDHEDMRYNLEAVLLFSRDTPITPVEPPPPTPPSADDGHTSETDDHPTTEQLTPEQALAILEQIAQGQGTWRYFNQPSEAGSLGDAW